MSEVPLYLQCQTDQSSSRNKYLAGSLSPESWTLSFPSIMSPRLEHALKRGAVPFHHLLFTRHVSPSLLTCLYAHSLDPSTCGHPTNGGRASRLEITVDTSNAVPAHPTRAMLRYVQREATNGREERRDTLGDKTARWNGMDDPRASAEQGTGWQAVAEWR